MPSDRIDPGSPGYLLIIFFFLFLAGGAIVLLGRSTIKRRRLSNSRKLYLITGVSEFQGQTAVVLGKIIEVIGYLWLGVVTFVFAPMALIHLSQRNQQEQVTGGMSSATTANTAVAAAKPKSSSRKMTAEEKAAYVKKRNETWAEIERKQKEDMERHGFVLDPETGEYFRPGMKPQKIIASPSGISTAVNPIEGKPNEQPPSPPSKSFRKWTSDDGKFSVTASYLGQTVMEVQLQKEDGSTLKVEKAKLSLEDIEWLQEHG